MTEDPPRNDGPSPADDIAPADLYLIREPGAAGEQRTWFVTAPGRESAVVRFEAATNRMYNPAQMEICKVRWTE